METRLSDTVPEPATGSTWTIAAATMANRGTVLETLSARAGAAAMSSAVYDFFYCRMEHPKGSCADTT